VSIATETGRLHVFRIDKTFKCWLNLKDNNENLYAEWASPMPNLERISVEVGPKKKLNVKK
jgi:hypothetical protein